MHLLLINLHTLFHFLYYMVLEGWKMCPSFLLVINLTQKRLIGETHLISFFPEPHKDMRFKGIWAIEASMPSWAKGKEGGLGF